MLKVGWQRKDVLLNPLELILPVPCFAEPIQSDSDIAKMLGVLIPLAYDSHKLSIKFYSYFQPFLKLSKTLCNSVIYLH